MFPLEQPTSDNVYSIMAVFGLALAYRRVDDDEGRACKFHNNNHVLSPSPFHEDTNADRSDMHIRSPKKEAKMEIEEGDRLCVRHEPKRRIERTFSWLQINLWMERPTLTVLCRSSNLACADKGFSQSVLGE